MIVNFSAGGGPVCLMQTVSVLGSKPSMSIGCQVFRSLFPDRFHHLLSS